MTDAKASAPSEAQSESRTRRRIAVPCVRHKELKQNLMLIPHLSVRRHLPLAPEGRIAAFLCALFLFAAAPRAEAQSAAPAPRTEEDSRFSVGAGLGYTFLGDTSLGGAAGLSGLGSRAPYATGLVEVRVHPRVRLGVGLTGSYTHAGARSGAAFGGSDVPEQSFRAGSASLSARYVLNPSALVEVSPLLAVGARTASSKGQQFGSVMNTDGSYDPVTQDTRDTGIDARLGLVLEYRLLPQLWLRMESNFVSASYSQIHATYRAPSKTTKGDFTQASIVAGFSPALQVRMTF